MNWRSSGAIAVSLAASLGSAHVQAAAGSALYDVNCAFCHQRAGVGAPGQFPRLAGRVSVIAADPRGRAYLVGILRNGLSGSITVDGSQVAGVMPAFPQLRPDELASILNYLIALPPAASVNPYRFSRDEVASLSTRVTSSQQLIGERESLLGTRVIP